MEINKISLFIGEITIKITYQSVQQKLTFVVIKKIVNLKQELKKN